MNNKLAISLLLLLSSLYGFTQNLEKQERLANTQMREGNGMFQKSNYADAEVAYKKSVATYPNNPKAIYNLGNSMVQQKRYKEAIAQYDYLAKSAKSNSLRAKSFHNIGNAYMGLNDFQKAVDAYKNSLRINPKDEETRYNLALAQELLKQQQDQNKDNKDNQNKDNKDQEKKDDKKKDDQNKEDENKEDQKEQDKEDDKNQNKDSDKDQEDKKDKPNEDKQDPEKDKGEEDKEQQQPQPGKLSEQQMKQLLEALQNEENKTQDKMNAKRVKGQKTKSEKDW